MIILFARKFRLVTAAVLVLTILAVAGYGVKTVVTKPVQAKDPGFKIYVRGLGTVQGAWAGPVGIAVTGVETRPDGDPGKELKVITLLVSNRDKKKVRFDPDIGLADLRGNKYSLQGADQPEVLIAPGATSQGTVIIDIPRGIKDEDWRLVISGGPLPGPVSLPLRVVTVKPVEPE